MSIWFAVPTYLILGYVGCCTLLGFYEGLCRGMREEAARKRSRKTVRSSDASGTFDHDRPEPMIVAPAIESQAALPAPPSEPVEEQPAEADSAYHVIGRRSGMVCIAKRCGFCRRKHVVEFPLDDLGVKRRMESFCDRCEEELRIFLEKHPEFRRRRRR